MCFFKLIKVHLLVSELYIYNYYFKFYVTHPVVLCKTIRKYILST